MIADQKFGGSVDLVIERDARNRNYDPTRGRRINPDPAGYISGGIGWAQLYGKCVTAVPYAGKSDGWCACLVAGVGIPLGSRNARKSV